MHTLTSAQKRYLKGLAHHLRPTVQIGKHGLTEASIASIEAAVEANELVKIQFVDHKDEKAELAQAAADAVGGALVGRIGNVAILFRRQPDPARQRLELPFGLDSQPGPLDGGSTRTA